MPALDSSARQEVSLYHSQTDLSKSAQVPLLDIDLLCQVSDWSTFFFPSYHLQNIGFILERLSHIVSVTETQAVPNHPYAAKNIYYHFFI